MKYRYRLLSLLFSLSIITYIDRVCISAAGTEMQKSLDIPPQMWGYVTGAFALSYALFEIPSGRWADKFGARNVLTRIVLWWSVFTALTGAVSNFVILLIVRFFFGAGEAGAYPGSTSAISRWFPGVERARATSIVWMASRIGGALTPLLVYPLQAAFGWRMSFFVFGVLGIIWSAVWWTWYRNTPEEKPGVTQAELVEIGNGSAKSSHHMPWGKVLSNRRYWIILAMYHTYCWGSYFYLSWLHTYLEKGRGFSKEELTFWAALPFICGALGNLFGGFISDQLVRLKGVRLGRCLVGATGLALSACMMYLTSQTTDRFQAAIYLALGYGFMDCMLPVAWAVCLDVGRQYAGAVSGSMNMAGQVGSFLTSVVFGYVVAANNNDYNAPLVPMSCLLLVSAFLFTLINPTKPLIAEGDDVQHLPKAA